MKLVSKDGSQIIDFEIPEKYKRILTFCSGGADSTILLYLLCLYFQKTNRIDTEIVVVTDTFKYGAVPANGRYAQQIVNKIIDYFPNHLINFHHIFYKGIYSYLPVIYKDEEIKIMGATTNPKTLSKKYFEDQSFFEHRIQGRDYTPKSCWDNSPNMSRIRYNPFYEIDKKFIADMYDKFNLLKTLFPLTWSCTVEGPEYNENYTKHCGFCWWCKERDWAFNFEDEQFPTTEKYKIINGAGFDPGPGDP